MARRRRWLILGIALIVAACQSETVTTTTVSVAPPSTTTTTSPSTTTTTVVDEPVDICSRGMVWESGTTYVADCFASPLTFLPEEDGWVSGGASDGHILIRWTDPEDRELEARVAFLTYASHRSAVEVLDRIAAVDGVEVIDGPATVEVGGWSGLSAELEGHPEQNAPVDPPCTVGDAVWFPPVKFGHGFFEVDRNRVAGVGACQVVQAWLVDVGGTTVTILAGTEEPENHQIAVDAAERLFASMTFGAAP